MLLKDNIDEAISTCLMDKTESLLPTALNMALDANSPIAKYHKSELALKTSNYYLRNNRPGYALETAIFIDVDERKRFYKSNGFIDEYINLLQKTENLSELYWFLKGCKNFEEGANIAMKFNDITNYIILRIMTIRSKLIQNQNVSCQIYSIEAQQNDAMELHLLFKKTEDYYLQQQLLYYITVLEGRSNHTDLKEYFKIKAFDLRVNVFKDDADVPTIFKNLRLLLNLHNNNYSDLNLCMIKFFDVLKIGQKYYISPLMLQELRVSDTKVYNCKRDEFGMAIMNRLQLQALFRKHTKSFAEKWLKILDKILGYKDDKYNERYHKFYSYVKVSDIINVIHYYINNIERKYYYDTFHIGCNCPNILGNDISVMLKNLLSFPWICYIQVVHKSVETFTWNPAIKSAIYSAIGQVEVEEFIEKWIFHGVNQQISNFIIFIEETIDSCLSTEIEMIELSPVVSKLEIITIGLLGIFSNINSEHEIVLPQSYEMVTNIFDSVNDYSFFSLITNSKMDSTDILLYYLRLIVEILLGDMHSKSLLSMAISMKYPDNYPKQYQFERCLVLALTLLGNLASYENDFYMLFYQSFKFLKTLTNKLRSHQKDFIPIINKIVNAFTTREVFIIINTIQQLHKRNMVIFNHPNSCFKKVLPANFPCFPLYSKPKVAQESIFAENAPLFNTMQDKSITHKDDKEDPKSSIIHDSEIKPSTVCKKQVLPEKFPLYPKPKITEEPVVADSAPLNTMQDKPIVVRKNDKGDTRSSASEVKPTSKATIYRKQVPPVHIPCFQLIYPKPKISKEPESASLSTVQGKPTITHKDDKEDPKSSIMHDTEVKSISKATLHKKQGSVEHIRPNPVPRELKLQPYFMLTKEEKASYGQVHIDKQVTKNS